MTAQEAYKRYSLKINKNDENTNIRVNEGEFVLIFNEQSKSYLKEKLKRDSDNSNVNYLSEFLVSDVPLILKKINNDSVEFLVPDDYFDTVTSYSIATKGSCKGRIIYNWNIKPKNKNVFLNNFNTKASFEYEETFTIYTDKTCIVYIDNFEIEQQYLTYYRLPKDIDIIGYKKIDGTFSINIDPDIPDILVNEIINRCVLETISVYENPEGFQLAQTRLNKE